MRNNLDAALEFGARGFYVFPLHSPAAGKPCDCNKADCTSPAKHPRTMHGLADATVDAPKIERWWGQWPHANIGVATGPASGIVVLDIDPRHGGDAEIRALMEKYGALPDGVGYETGSGGAHFWFRHPGFKITSRNSIAPGIDVKGDGGYVIVPPSVHSTGGGYQWYEGSGLDAEIPDLPVWLVGLMQQGDTSRHAAAPIEADVVENRNNTLTSLAGTLRNRGLGEAQIFKLLMSLNETWSNPLPATEVGKIAASIVRYDPVISAPVIVDTGRGKKGKTERTPRQPYLPRPYTLQELMDMDLPDVRMVIPDLLPEGLAVLAGKPKLGKSWMSFNLGLAVASGGTALGTLPVDEGEVLILALEDKPKRLRKRFMQLLGDDPLPRGLYMETAWPRENEGGALVLDTWLGQHPDCVLVVIDTLAKFRALGEDSGYAQDYAAMEGLQELAGKHGVCIMVITHYRKASSEDWLDNVTGTLGVAGGADTIIGLERPRGFAGQASAILHVTGRDLEEKDYALKWDAMTAQWAILGDADEYTMGLETAKLIDALKENGAPMKVAALAIRLSKKQQATSNLCARAAAAGYVRNYGGGLYGIENNGGLGG